MNGRSALTLLTALVIAFPSVPVMAQGGLDPDYVEPPHGQTVPGIVSSIYLDIDRNKIFDALDHSLGPMGPLDIITAIVVFNHTINNTDVLTFQVLYGPFVVRYQYTIINAFSANLTKAQVYDFANRTDVNQIEENADVQLFTDTTRQYFGVDKAVSDFGVTGDGDNQPRVYGQADSVVCVIDSGVDTNHQDLDGTKVILWVDLVNGGNSPYDDYGHGTQMTGIIAGEGDANWAYRGVAYGAAIVAIKAADSHGNGPEDRFVYAFQECTDNANAFNIKIINLSGGSYHRDANGNLIMCIDGSDSLANAEESAWNDGILTVAAAGNNGPGACNVPSPGTAVHALTVCMIVDPGLSGWYVDPASGRGYTADHRVKPDICGPAQVMAAKAGTTNQYVASHGTSPAAAFISGVAALMLAADRSASAQTIRDKLTQHAEDWRNTGKDIDTGFGRMQAYDSIKAMGGWTGTGPAVPVHNYFTETIDTDGAHDHWRFTLHSQAYAPAITLIIPGANGGSKDFDLRLFWYDGTSWNLAGTSAGVTREEYIIWTNGPTGDYYAEVSSSIGTGNYYVDFSCDCNVPWLSVDQ